MQLPADSYLLTGQAQDPSIREKDVAQALQTSESLQEVQRGGQFVQAVPLKYWASEHSTKGGRQTGLFVTEVSSVPVEQLHRPRSLKVRLTGQEVQAELEEQAVHTFGQFVQLVVPNWPTGQAQSMPRSTSPAEQP